MDLEEKDRQNPSAAVLGKEEASMFGILIMHELHFGFISSPKLCNKYFKSNANLVVDALSEPSVRHCVLQLLLSATIHVVLRFSNSFGTHAGGVLSKLNDERRAPV